MHKDKKCLVGRYGQKADYTGKFCSRMCEGPMRSEFDIQVVEEFMSHLNDLFDVSDHFRRNILPMLWVRRFPKKERIVMPGEICTTSFWLQYGYGRCFILTTDEEGLPFEKTIKFFGQGKIAAIHSGFFNEEPCDFYFEISAGAVVVPFSRSCFETLKLNVPEIGNITNNIMAKKEPEHLEKMELIGLKARERYHEFLRIFGVGIEQHFAIKHIASYLKIPPSYLSKIRSELYRK